MKLPNGATVAVVDGAKLHIFRNSGDEANSKLNPLPEPTIGGNNKVNRPGFAGGHLV